MVSPPIDLLEALGLWHEFVFSSSWPPQEKVSRVSCSYCLSVVRRASGIVTDLLTVLTLGLSLHAGPMLIT
jgi:hypothetical protein